MGIQGLLPLLKSIHEHRKISEFSGQRLAVDGYVWLHRGAYGCATQLVKGEPTTRYVDYAMHRIRILRHHNILPFVVFDGGPLPAKKGTESSRLKSRQENKDKGMAYLKEGKDSEARECFTKAVDVTPEMAYQLIKALRSENVPYIVAPYEADSQLAFLEKSGLVDGIITEDSDLLVFGCKKVIFKLDSDGNCVCIRRENFAKVKEIPLHGWGDKQFREMAMLSGCDYLPSIPGLGVKTSHKLLRKHKTVEGVLNAIRSGSSLTIPPGYLLDFRTAELAFLYQRVYDPTSQKLVHLSSVPEDIGDWDDKYIGEDMDPIIARRVAEGSVHPFTLMEMTDILPNYRPNAKNTLSFGRTTSQSAVGAIVTVRKSKALLTNYFSPTPGLRKSSSETILRSKYQNDTKENTPTHAPAFPNLFSSGRRTLTAEHDDAILRALAVNERIRAVSTTSRFFSDVRTNATLDPSMEVIASPPNAPEYGAPQSEEVNLVTQEDGYQSPTYSDFMDLSSPPRSREVTPEPVAKISFEIEELLSPGARFLPCVQTPLSPTLQTPPEIDRNPVLLYQHRNEDKFSRDDYLDEIDEPTDRGISISKKLASFAYSSKKQSPQILVSATPTQSPEKDNLSTETILTHSTDLADIFSTCLSENSSVVGEFNVSSPPPSPPDATIRVEDDFAPKSIMVPGVTQDFQDEEIMEDEAYASHNAEAAQRIAFQSQWQITWSNKGNTKRKPDAISPRTDRAPKRSLQRRKTSHDRDISPTPHSHPSVLPRRSLPNLPAQKPQIQKSIRYPNTSLHNTKTDIGSESLLDLESFRHHPLRLR